MNTLADTLGDALSYALYCGRSWYFPNGSVEAQNLPPLVHFGQLLALTCTRYALILTPHALRP
jgi:hypothetical protein